MGTSIGKIVGLSGTALMFGAQVGPNDAELNLCKWPRAIFQAVPEHCLAGASNALIYGIAGLMIAFGIWRVALSWWRKRKSRSAPNAAQVKTLQPEMIPFYESARRAYEETINTYGLIIGHLNANDPDEIIKQYAYELAPRLKIFGERPPSRKVEVFPEDMRSSALDFEVENETIVAVERFGKGRWINLTVRASDLPSVIEKLELIAKAHGYSDL